MADPNTLDNRTLIKRTFITMGAMVGACLLVVGSVTLIASCIVDRAIAPPGEGEHASSSGLVPPANIHGALARPIPMSTAAK